jgi:hypothetical protein
MNLHKFVDLLFETIATSAGRPLAAVITAAPAETWFAELPPEEDWAPLQKAAADIGESLAEGEGEIGPKRLAKAVDAFHQQSGTSYCPPLITALDHLEA